MNKVTIIGISIVIVVAAFSLIWLELIPGNIFQVDDISISKYYINTKCEFVYGNIEFAQTGKKPFEANEIYTSEEIGQRLYKVVEKWGGHGYSGSWHDLPQGFWNDYYFEKTMLDLENQGINPILADKVSNGRGQWLPLHILYTFSQEDISDDPRCFEKLNQHYSDFINPTLIRESRLDLPDRHKQNIADTLGSPKNAGVIGSEHSHAAVLVNILGDKFNFSAPAYQIKSSWIHFEGSDGSTVHKHATGITLGYLFETLGLGIDNQCFIFQDGRSFCTNNDYSLTFYINGEQFADIRDYEIQEDDRILISYGAETPEELQAQLSQLENQEIKK